MEPSIEEMNIALAEFEGLVVEGNRYILPNGLYQPIRLLDYHTNWNSLMRVVEKVESLGLSVNTITTDARIGVKYRVIINANVDGKYKYNNFLERDTKLGVLHESLYLFTQFIKTQQQ